MQGGFSLNASAASAIQDFFPVSQVSVKHVLNKARPIILANPH
jgi:hypothetical protein